MLPATGFHRLHDTAQFTPQQLPSGITLWTQSPVVTTDHGDILIACLPQVGSRLDPAGAAGTAHFFEHITLRGTERFPSYSNLFDPIEEVGGELNATTSWAFTRFYATLPEHDLETAAGRLASLVQAPLLRETDLEEEKKVIAQEFHQTYGDSLRLVSELAGKALFGAHPLNHSAIGELDVIQSMETTRLREFHQRHYHRGNLQLICGGTFANRPDAHTILEDAFGGIRNGEAASLACAEPLPFDRSGVVSFSDRRLRFDALLIIYAIRPSSQRDMAALLYLSDCFANGIRSPLARVLRERLGLIYATRLAFDLLFRDIWIIGFQVPVSATAFGTVRDQFRKVLESIGEDTVERYRSQLQRRRAMSFQSPVTACLDAVRDLQALGTVRSWKQREEWEDDLTLPEILRWRDYFLSVPPLECEFHTAK